MLMIDRLAEEIIQNAIRRGELKDLPGQGKPLSLEDNSAIPESLRVAYRVLKNAGCLPPEQELRHEIRQLEALLGQVDADAQAQKIGRRLGLLQTRLALRGCEVNLLLQEEAYRERLFQRLSRQIGKSQAAGTSVR